MKIALEATTKVGSRAARVLLAERSVEAIGLIGRRSTSGDPRVSTITNLAGWDVVATDDSEHMELRYRQASDHGIPLVVPTGRSVAVPHPDIPFVLDANPSFGLAACLAASECSRNDTPMEAVVGWTTPGRRLRRGHALSFPQPIGNLWANEGEDVWPEAPQATQFLAAPVEGPWTGLAVRVTTATQEGVEVRTLGVTDETAFLDGIALAAAVLAAGAGVYPVGINYPTAAFREYLDLALRAGLDVATFVERR
ncbi:MAG: hypothetical protein ACXW15_13030 [Acidimicrobiia bacterium]